MAGTGKRRNVSGPIDAETRARAGHVRQPHRWPSLAMEPLIRPTPAQRPRTRWCPAAGKGFFLCSRSVPADGRRRTKSFSRSGVFYGDVAFGGPAGRLYGVCEYDHGGRIIGGRRGTAGRRCTYGQAHVGGTKQADVFRFRPVAYGGKRSRSGGDAGAPHLW